MPDEVASEVGGHIDSPFNMDYLTSAGSTINTLVKWKKSDRPFGSICRATHNIVITALCSFYQEGRAADITSLRS